MLNESQQILFDLCRPHWIKKHEREKAKGHIRAKALCMQDMLCWMGNKSGVGYKQFNQLTNEDINKIIPIIEQLT
jgi:hypothetical protein